jgi:Fe-S-cluster containining protein
MPPTAAELNQNRRKIEQAHRKFYDRLLKHRRPGLDEEVVELHHEVFANTDCLGCANCCKTISPVFKERDIKRLADHLGLKPGEVVARHLHLDEDGDYIPNAVPCPFLGNDNRCSIYEVRPFACSSYPHTDTLPLRKQVDLIVKNSAVCPAVYEITSKLINKYDHV